MAQRSDNEEGKKKAKEETSLRRYKEFEGRLEGRLKLRPFGEAAATTAALNAFFGAGEE